MSTPIPIPIKVSLQASSASVKEGAVAKLTVIGDPNAQIPYFIVGLTPEDLASGAVNGRVMLDDLGIGTISLGIAADGETEGTETLIVNAANSFAIMSVEDSSRSNTKYFIESAEGEVGEGKVATFSVSAENGVPGTKLPYTITGSGITSKDVINGKLSGSVALGADGSAIITVPIKADATTEGDEELTVTLTGRGAAESITIEDTSTETVVAASYTLWAPESAIEEGDEAEFLIETSPSEAGKSLKWSVTGITAADVAGKKLSGNVIIGRDGTAGVLIPTATDGLKEGSETLTLTLNNQKASVTLLDNQSIRIASVVLESDSQGTWGVYRLEDGSSVIAEAGLVQGDELADYVPLKASPSKNYSLPKTVASLISYEDGSFGLLTKSGTSYSEQKFSDVGIAQGGALKLTVGQLLAKESASGIDLNRDGIVGDAVAAVLDGDGDPTQQEYGLYRALSGSLAVSQSGLEVGDELIDALVLQASKGKPLSLKASQAVLGLAQTAAGDWEVLIRSGKALSTQAFDAQTGIASGKVVTVKPADLKSKETQYGLDLDGDGQVGIGELLSKTLTEGRGVNKALLQVSGERDLTIQDVGVSTSSPNYHQALALGASGAPGSTLNIDFSNVASGFNKPLVVGAMSTDRQSDAGKEIEAVQSTIVLPFPGIVAGLLQGSQGVINIDDAKIYFAGGLISSLLLRKLISISEDLVEGEREYYENMAFSVLAAGSLTDSRGVININDSDLYFGRNIYSSEINFPEIDELNAVLDIGARGGGDGVAHIKSSNLELTGTQNAIIVGELGSSGRLSVNDSVVLVRAQYNKNSGLPTALSKGSYATVNVGKGDSAVGNFEINKNTHIDIIGRTTDIFVGVEGGNGSFMLSDSKVQLKAERSLEPLTRKTNPLTIKNYAQEWSAASLVIGYDDNDGSASTNALSRGSVRVLDDSVFIVRGPEAAIEIGGSGTRSTGELIIDDSIVEVVASGAILKPGASGKAALDYIAVDEYGRYRSDVSIGGSNWQDFGGVGAVTVANGSELKIYEFDITSGDKVLEANQASLNIGAWGTKASLVIEGSSKVSVAGSMKLGLVQDMSGTNFSTDAGLANVSNYSMANIANGRLDVFYYNSSVANQGLKSPLTNYAMYTVLGNQGTLTANQFGFYKNSQIIGSGKIILDDVFSNSRVSLHSDIDTTSSHVVKDAGSDGFMMIDETELFIGDSFNFDTLGRRSGFGTLTMKDETGSEHRGTLTLEDSTLVFDLSKSQSDKLVIEGFDYCAMNRNDFVVNGNGLLRGERYVLIDFRLKAGGFSGDLEQLLNVKLVGVKGELTYDAEAMDVVFTVQ